MYGMLTTLSLVLSLGLFGRAAAFDITSNSNLAVYWGQDGAGNQQSLSYYCADDTIDTIPMAFLYQFSGEGNMPVIDLSNACSSGSKDFAGSDLADCSFMASDIKTCQSKGKIVTMSLGGATGQVGFSSDSQAESLADQVWEMFLGGSSDTRPFGDAVLDGVDLDIESGTPAHYPAFVNRIRSHAQGASKKYYVTAAPQCPFPDVYIGEALNEAEFDAVYVQFYNNYCGLNAPSEYNFATWDNWAKTQSANKNVKVYIGAPGSPSSAGSGYVDESTLANFAKEAQEKYSSFGGVMLWDASTAYSNNRYDKSIKNSMTSSSGNHPAPPAASSAAPAQTSSKVSSSAAPAKTSSKAATSSAAEKTSSKVSSSVATLTSSASAVHSSVSSKAPEASSTEATSAPSKETPASSKAAPTPSEASSSAPAPGKSAKTSSASASSDTSAPSAVRAHPLSSSAAAAPTSTSSTAAPKPSSPSSAPAHTSGAPRPSSAPAKTCNATKKSTKRAQAAPDAEVQVDLSGVAFTMPRRHSRTFKRHSSRR